MKFCTSLAIACMAVTTCAGQLKVIKPEALYQAVQRAQDEQKFLYVAFLGDGWSVSCKKFKSQVLETPQFREFANLNLVYFPVEARRKPKLTSEETATLQSWVIHFDVKSYPTLILLAPDGQEMLRHGFKDIEAADYVGLLKAVLPDRISQRS